LGLLVAILYPTVEDMRWFALGVTVSFCCWFSAIYGEIAFRHDSLKGALLILAAGASGLFFLRVMIEPRFETRVGDVLLLSFFVGLLLGFSPFGIPMYKHKRQLEIEFPEASQDRPRNRYSAEYWRTNSPILTPSGATPSASLLILTSAGVMLWASFDIATDPSYGGLTTTDDLVGWLLITVPNLASFIVLLFAWASGRIRYYMLAAMLSGFSFAAPLSVLAEIALWRTHKKHGRTW
jgi:hypothetical protein